MAFAHFMIEFLFFFSNFNLSVTLVPKIFSFFFDLDMQFFCHVKFYYFKKIIIFELCLDFESWLEKLP